ncbi:MAG: PLD nuclease N-terminal domain-containing protein [Janthinobacterium lividum]
MDMIAAFFLALSAIALLLDLWAMASVWRTTKPARTKYTWALMIFFLPFVGVAIWGVFGPRGLANPPSSPNHSKG